MRPGNTHDSHGAVAVLKRLLSRLRAAYPKALILVRADAGFAVPALYEFLEMQENVRYVMILAFDYFSPVFTVFQKNVHVICPSMRWDRWPFTFTVPGAGEL